jgi:hypothetical protein
MPRRVFDQIERQPRIGAIASEAKQSRAATQPRLIGIASSLRSSQ